MALNKRERILILILSILIFFVAYYKLIINPLHEKLNQIKIENEKGQIQHADMEYNFLLESQQDDLIQIIKTQVLNHASKYFGTIHQENIILLLNDFINNSNLEVLSLSFFESTMDKETDSNIDKNINDNEYYVGIFSTEILFTCNYNELITFLSCISEHDKKIIIKNMHIKIDPNKIIAGNIILDFYSMDIIDSYYPKELHIFHDHNSYYN